MLSLIQNLRIGTKLAVASALGILLVAAMIAGQIVGNGTVRRSNESALAQQVLARDAVEATLALRSMQVSARDIRLASNPADLQKANDSLLERSKSFSDAVEAMLKLSRSLENRARMEELKRLLMVYLEGVHQLASIRSEAIAVTGSGSLRDQRSLSALGGAMTMYPAISCLVAPPVWRSSPSAMPKLS